MPLSSFREQLYSNKLGLRLLKTSHNNNLPTVCYEIFVRAFYDSNNDGIGDLNGITSKLDYREDLSIEEV